MPKRIPVEAAKKFALENGCRQVVVMAWDGSATHIVTYGATLEECAQAAIGGNKVKKALGWPESLMDDPAPVKALKKKVADLEKKVWMLETKAKKQGGGSNGECPD
jgi:hypothetical protein